MNRAEKRVREIVEQKEQELEEPLAEDSQRREFEADRSGYMYSVQAGFESEGCFRAMEVLARTPGAEFDTTPTSNSKKNRSTPRVGSGASTNKIVSKGRCFNICDATLNLRSLSRWRFLKDSTIQFAAAPLETI